MTDAELLNHATEFAFPIEEGFIGIFNVEGSWHAVKSINGATDQYLSRSTGWTLTDTDKPLTKDFTFRYLREILQRAGIDEPGDSSGVFDISKRRRIGNLFNATSTDLGMNLNA